MPACMLASMPDPTPECMLVCMHACLYAYLCVWLFVRSYISLYVCWYVSLSHSSAGVSVGGDMRWLELFWDRNLCCKTLTLILVQTAASVVRLYRYTTGSLLRHSRERARLHCKPPALKLQGVGYNSRGVSYIQNICRLTMWGNTIWYSCIL
jgi:hypothetical protein